MSGDLVVAYGYRSKAQRVAEFRLLAKNAGLSTYQRNILEKTLKSVCDDLAHCSAVRGKMVSRSYAVNSAHRDAVTLRSQKKK